MMQGRGLCWFITTEIIGGTLIHSHFLRQIFLMKLDNVKDMEAPEHHLGIIYKKVTMSQFLQQK